MKKFCSFRFISFSLSICVLLLTTTAFGEQAQTSSCHLLETQAQFDELNSQYAPPFKVFSPLRELFIRVSCQTPTQFSPGGAASIAVSVGTDTADRSTYIYKDAYQFTTGQWSLVNLSGQHAVESNWYSGNATGSWLLSPSFFGQTNFFVGYACFWDESRWKCGCQTQECTNEPQWSIQTYRFSAV